MAAHRQVPTSSRRPPLSEGESAPDETIGDFHIGKEIGKGSFATVYLAKHRKKKSYAAIGALFSREHKDKQYHGDYPHHDDSCCNELIAIHRVRDLL